MNATIKNASFILLSALSSAALSLALLFPVGVSAGPDGPLGKNVFISNGCQVEVKWAPPAGAKKGAIPPIELTLKSLTEKDLEPAIDMSIQGQKRAETMSRVMDLNYDTIWTDSRKFACKPSAHTETVIPPPQASSEMTVSHLWVKGEGKPASGIFVSLSFPLPEVDISSLNIRGRS